MAFLKKYLTFYLLVFGSFILVAVMTNHAVTVFSTARQAQPGVTIVIDPGHGGEDGGAVSCTGVYESGINLEIALRMDDLLHFMGYNTRMVRTEDIYVHDSSARTISEKKVSDLKNRVALVNDTENALLLSIHQNQFPESKYFGAQVFYAPTEGSQDLAKLTQQLLVTSLNPKSSRQCKPASGVYLMDHISCTAVLVECGFLSNPQEEANLRDPSYQQKLCCVMACCLSQFLTERQNMV